jgi:hypothetical protein
MVWPSLFSLIVISIYKLELFIDSKYMYDITKNKKAAMRNHNCLILSVGVDGIEPPTLCL